MTEPLLRVDGLEVTYEGDPPAVADVDLTVFAGETVAVVGESGSGKSTLAAAVLGLLPPGGRVTAGRIVFDGTDLTAMGDRALRRVRGRGIGYVPQDPVTNLNPVWKVGTQIREALRANNVKARDIARARSVQLLTDVGMPDPVGALARYPHQLSGGMCQRALIAIGLAGRPRLLIADEPTSALDVTVQRQVLDHLADMAAGSGTAVLFITHDLALAAERAGRIIVMRSGRIVEAGAAEQIITDPQDDYTRRLVACAPALAAPAHRPAARPDAEDLVVATDVTKVFDLPGRVPWRHRGFTAVDAVSFRLRRGSTLAVAGESGSGKTTLAHLVLGLTDPTSGTVTFDGADVSHLHPDQVRIGGVGVIDQGSKDDGPRGRQGTARPPEVEGAGVAVADRLLPGRLGVDGVEGQRHRDQLLLPRCVVNWGLWAWRAGWRS